MIKAEFLDNGLLRVISKQHSWNETETNYWYYDLKKNKKNANGKENEALTQDMTDGDKNWINKVVIPLAEKQKIERDDAAVVLMEKARLDPFSVDPERFEKSRRYNVLVTASLVEDGSYRSMSRDEIKTERANRYTFLCVSMRMPSDQEVYAAGLTIQNDDEYENSSKNNRERVTS